jgi:predicted transposase YdaD
LTPTTLEIYRPDGRKFVTPVELDGLYEQAEQRADAEQKRADTERQARLNAVSQLLQTGMSAEQVAQILSLTVEEVESLR